MKKIRAYHMLICLLINLIISISFSIPIVAESIVPSGPSIIRVALSNNSATSELKIEQGNYLLVDLITQLSVTATSNANLVVSPVGSLNMRILSNNEIIPEMTGSLILLKQISESETGLISYQGKPYRGHILLHNNNGKINIINVLDVEQYLYGVLPKEMGISTAPIEALKAQAIVSRTYALKQKNVGAAYDLSATNSSQVYGGYISEVAFASKAVDDTKGQVIYYNNQLINAYFSSNAGGYTESSENVWNSALNYAKAVPSPYDSVALNKIQDSTGWPGYCFQWEINYNLVELENKITKWNQANPNNSIQVGKVTGLEAKALAFDKISRNITNQPNESGRITELVILGTQGKTSLYKENIRNFLDLRSNLFQIISEGGTLVRNGAGVVNDLTNNIQTCKGIIAFGQAQEINPQSNSYFVATADGVKEIKKNTATISTSYKILGKGFGHGVGMSQWGAIGMAEAGKTYLEIIEYYYNQGKNDGALRINILSAN